MQQREHSSGMRVLRYLAALVLSTSLLAGTSAVAATPATTVEQEAVAAIQSLAPGEHLVLGTALIARTTEGLVVTALQPKRPNIQLASTATFCGTALAAAIFGIGAGILGFIAASTGGTGTVILAGYAFSGAQVGMMAGISGSYAALLAWISREIC